MVAAVAAKAHWKNHSDQRPFPPEGVVLVYLNVGGRGGHRVQYTLRMAGGTQGLRKQEGFRLVGSEMGGGQSPLA